MRDEGSVLTAVKESIIFFLFITRCKENFPVIIRLGNVKETA